MRKTPVSESRSRNMAAIKAKDSKSELLIRRGLHEMGRRFRLGWSYKPGGKYLPGKPDLVFPGRRAVIFVNGCYWHGHECPLFRWPKTEAEFWREKIAANIARDRRVREELRAGGWRIADVWECTLKGRGRVPAADILAALDAFLSGDGDRLVIGADQTVTISEDV